MVGRVGGGGVASSTKGEREGAGEDRDTGGCCEMADVGEEEAGGAGEVGSSTDALEGGCKEMEVMGGV